MTNIYPYLGTRVLLIFDIIDRVISQKTEKNPPVKSSENNIHSIKQSETVMHDQTLIERVCLPHPPLPPPNPNSLLLIGPVKPPFLKRCFQGALGNIIGLAKSYCDKF